MWAHLVTRETEDIQAVPSPCFCEERYQLLDEFLDAVRQLNHIHSEQIQAIIRGDRDFARFDVLAYFAQERKDAAKYAWMAHIETHHCEEESVWP